MTPMVTLWETGERQPNDKQLVRICDALDVSADELLGRKGSEVGR